MNSLACSECGARIAKEGERCPLCGWRKEISKLERTPNVLPPPEASLPVSCNVCGWENPPKARFCSQCGRRQQAKSSKQLSTSKTSAPLRQVAILMGAAVSLVIAIFMVSAVSKRTFPNIEESPEPAETEAVAVAPLTGALAEQIADLDARISTESGAERITLLREKTFLLMQADRTDLAAVEYQAIAEITGAAEDWRLAGDLFYDWMNSQEDPAIHAQIATSAIAAYEKVLELEPEDHGVRTDLATAYLSTGSPMLGVTEIKRVLEEDPTHVQANFNYGLMLWQIGRTEQASEQFVKVMDLTEAGSALHTRAGEALEMLSQGGF